MCHTTNAFSTLSTFQLKRPNRNRERNTVETSSHIQRSITSYATSARSTGTLSCPPCLLCKPDKHPLYACAKFKALSHTDKATIVKSNNLCLNCLKPGHSSRSCRSLYHCKTCNKSHHSLLHINDFKLNSERATPAEPSTSYVTSNAALGLDKKLLLMTCQLVVESPEGTSIKVRGVLDSTSSASFILERLSQVLKLYRSSCGAQVSGIGGMLYPNSEQSTATFVIISTHCPEKRMNVTAIIVPKVTCDLPTSPVPCDHSWEHLRDVELADPQFGIPGRIDILFGIEVFASVLRQGRRTGPANSPIVFETDFGWVLAGTASPSVVSHATIVANHVSVTGSSDTNDILRKVWEIEESTSADGPLTAEQKMVADHFERRHTRSEDGSFIVPLPKRPNHKPIGESCSMAIRRFVNLEKSMRAKGQFEDFESVLNEYFELEHAEVVPKANLEKPCDQVFYLPKRAVRKDSTKLRVVFDALAKSSTGISLNDTLLVGHTVHSSLIDVLLFFRSHRVALIADVSKMYRAVRLSSADRDLHRFVWRGSPDEPLTDYRMTRVTFGVSASCFPANMSIKQNSVELASQYPLAAKAVKEDFYVDDGLTGADSVEEAIMLQHQLQEMFQKGGFLLRKWSSSCPQVIENLPPELKGMTSLTISDVDVYTKTLGIEWSAVADCFRLTMAELPPPVNVTERFLVSDVAKTFDILGWFSPLIILVKILLQRLWEMKIDWDDIVPQSIREIWLRWRKS